MSLQQLGLHDAENIQLLQQAHADHIESIYRGLSKQLGNPDGVHIKSFGATRTFIANGWRMENRIIFSGNESVAEIDAVLDYFDQHKASCVIEVNPANFYHSQPFSWNAELLSYLMSHRCRIRHFRCVWLRSTPVVSLKHLSQKPIVMYGPEQIDTYITLDRQVESEADREVVERRLLFGESQPGWYHYVGYADDIPCATASLFVGGAIGYLAHSYTHPNYRQRGYHGALIRERVQHATALGCQLVFSVTDSYTQSARDLQREEFSLAYNYLMLIRDSPAAT